jgi:hypothetical protein
MALKKKRRKIGKGISYSESRKCRKLDEFGNCEEESEQK